MNNVSDREKFQAADRLFREGHYTQSLGLLSELNKAYPRTRKILYPIALCLERLGRTGESINVCNWILANEPCSHTRALKARLESVNIMPTLDGNLAEDLLGLAATPRATAPLPAAQMGAGDLLRPVATAVGCITGLAGLFLLIGLVNGATGLRFLDWWHDMVDMTYWTRYSAGQWLVLCMECFGISVVVGTAGCYLALRITGNLPNDDLFPDLRDLALVMALCSVQVVANFAIQYGLVLYFASPLTLIFAAVFVFVGFLNAGRTAMNNFDLGAQESLLMGLLWLICSGFVLVVASALIGAFTGMFGEMMGVEAIA